MLRAHGGKLIPALRDMPVTAVYAGLRPATEEKHYRVTARPEVRAITLGGIRSTGLSAALGLAQHALTLFSGFGGRLAGAPDIPAVTVPNLTETEPRDWQRPDHGEIVCHCELVTRREIEAALASPLPPGDFGGLRRRTRAGMGRCQGFYCAARLAEMTKGRLCHPTGGGGQGMTPAAVADVVIVGGGPAGVAAAITLRRAGVAQVVLLDREPALGGATRHCSHSPFGMREFGRVYLGGAYGRRLEHEARAAGVTVLTGHSVTALGDDGTVSVTHAQGGGQIAARRVLLATGARELSRAARMLPGDRPVGVLTTGALQAFVALHGLMPFRRPVIVGSELVSLSAVLTCLSHGARPVALIEPGPQPLARPPLTWFPG